MLPEKEGGKGMTPKEYNEAFRKGEQSGIDKCIKIIKAFKELKRVKE